MRVVAVQDLEGHNGSVEEQDDRCRSTFSFHLVLPQVDMFSKEEH